MIKIFLKIFKYGILCFFLLILLFALSVFVVNFFVKNVEYEKWEHGQGVLPKVFLNKNYFEIENLRNFNWSNETWDYKNEKYDFADFESLEVGVSRFAKNDGIGHTFLVFNFIGGDSVGVSIEARRGSEQKFSLTGGVYGKFSLMYVLASREDLLSLREKRNEELYMFPVKITGERAMALFYNIAKKSNELLEGQKMYNLFFANCTNLLVNEAKEIFDLDFSFYVKTFAPGYAGEELFERGLLKSGAENVEELMNESLIRFD